MPFAQSIASGATYEGQMAGTLKIGAKRHGRRRLSADVADPDRHPADVESVPTHNEPVELADDNAPDPAPGDEPSGGASAASAALADVPVTGYGRGGVYRSIGGGKRIKL